MFDWLANKLLYKYQRIIMNKFIESFDTHKERKKKSQGISRVSKCYFIRLNIQNDLCVRL